MSTLLNNLAISLAGVVRTLTLKADAFYDKDADGNEWVMNMTMGNPVRKDASWAIPKSNGTVPDVSGFIAVTGTGTPGATAANRTITSRHTRARRIDFLHTTAATTAVAGARVAQDAVVRGASAGIGGFYSCAQGAQATGGATATSRFFMGLAGITTAPTDAQPSAQLNCIGIGYDAADVNYQIMHNDGTGTATKIDTGWAVPTTDREDWITFETWCIGGGSTVNYRATREDGATFSGSISTDLPGTSTYMSPRCWASVGGTSSVIGIGFGGFYMENREMN